MDRERQAARDAREAARRGGDAGGAEYQGDPLPAINDAAPAAWGNDDRQARQARSDRRVRRLRRPLRGRGPRGAGRRPASTATRWASSPACSTSSAISPAAPRSTPAAARGRLARALGGTRRARRRHGNVAAAYPVGARALDPGGAIDYRVADLCQPLPDLVGALQRHRQFTWSSTTSTTTAASPPPSARRLAPGGRLVLALNNPYSYVVRKHVGRLLRLRAPPTPTAAWRRRASSSISIHRTLEEYLDAFLTAGLRLTTLTDLSKVVNNAHQAPDRHAPARRLPLPLLHAPRLRQAVGPTAGRLLPAAAPPMRRTGRVGRAESRAARGPRRSAWDGRRARPASRARGG